MSARSPKRFTPLLLCAFPTLCPAKSLAPNTGNIHLESSITMNVQIAQPGGACASGYVWHATYGGCRRAVAEEEQQRKTCGVDYTGEQTRVRARTQYVLQSTGQAAHDPWGAWSVWDRSACAAQPRRTPGVISGLIALAVGGGNEFYSNGSPTPKALRIRMPWEVRGRGSTYAVTLDRTTAQLRCVLSIETSSSHGENSWPLEQAWLLGADESFHTEGGHCQVSQNQTQAHLAGHCDWTTGNDAGECMWGEKTVSIVSVSACSATVEVFDRLRHPQRSQRAYPLCA